MFRDAVREFAETEVRAARLGDGRGGAVPARADPEVLRAGADGDRGAGAVRRRRRRRSSCRCSPSRSSRGWTRPRRSTWTSTTRWSTTPSSGGATTSSSGATSRGSPRDLLGAFALSEPGSGSDAFALATRAERTGDGWELTGRKFWITNGAEAGVFIVFANVDSVEGLQGDHGVHRRARVRRASRSARRRTSSASAPRAPPS